MAKKVRVEHHYLSLTDWRRLTVFGLALVVGFAGLVLVAGLRTWSAVEHLRAARSLATADLNLASAVAACTEVEAAYEDVAFFLPLAHIARIVPNARAQVGAQAPALGRAAYHGCRGLRSVSQIIVSGVVDSGSGEDAGFRLLPNLAGNQKDLQAITASLVAMIDALQEVDTRALANEAQLEPLVRNIEEVQAKSALIQMLARVVPQGPMAVGKLLGVDRPRTYLLVGQNEDEIRATGGYWGTLGVLTVADGRVVHTDVRSSELWDNPSVPKLFAPEPLQKYMNFGGWYLRDANWWVDFRRSAAQLLLMWDREWGNADTIDGVIAIDSTALEMLLESLGTVEIPELGGEVDASNVVSLLDEVRIGDTLLASDRNYNTRKSAALAALHKGIVSAVTGASSSDSLWLLYRMAQAAEDKHVLMWFRDPDLQALVGALGWDGRVDSGSGDFLGVVDTTISYSKMAPYIRRSVKYDRQMDGMSTVEITYSNAYRTGAATPFDVFTQGIWWDWKASSFRREQGTWLNYLRVLAPAASVMLDADGFDDLPVTTSEGSVAVFGAPVMVRPGETRVVRMIYKNPTPLTAPLRLFQQPGLIRR